MNACLVFLLFVSMYSCEQDDDLKIRLIGTWEVNRNDTLEYKNGNIDPTFANFDVEFLENDSMILRIFRYHGSPKVYDTIFNFKYYISEDINKVISVTIESSTEINDPNFPRIYLLRTYIATLFTEQDIILYEEYLFDESSEKKKNGSTWRMKRIE